MGLTSIWNMTYQDQFHHHSFINFTRVDPECSTGNCSTACTDLSTLFGTNDQPSNMYQCLKYQEISVDIDNGIYTDEEITYFSSLGIYSAKEQPDALLTAGKLIADCFIEYCLVAPNQCLPAFAQTAYGPYSVNYSDTNETDYRFFESPFPFSSSHSKYWRATDMIEFPSTYDSVCTGVALFAKPNRSTLGISGQLELYTALTCLINICTPSAQANPDIAGIGVMTSIIVQLVFAYLIVGYSIIEFVYRLFNRLRAAVEGRKSGLEHYPIIESPNPGRLNRAFYTVTVEFFKAQCYFSYAIEVACFKFLANLQKSGNVGDFLVIDRICACITPPTIATLSAINIAGYSSWYLTHLATLSVVLTMCIEGISFRMGSTYVAVKAVEIDFPACGGSSPLLVNPCPAWPVKPFLGDLGPGTDWKDVIPSLASSISCILVIIGLRLTHNMRLEDKRALDGGTPKHQWIKPLIILTVCIPTFVMGMGGASSALNQIMRDSGPLKQHYSRLWSFGQIVAVLVWLPCIVEWIYLFCVVLNRGHKYPLLIRPLLQVTGRQEPLSRLHSPSRPAEDGLETGVPLSRAQTLLL